MPTTDTADSKAANWQPMETAPKDGTDFLASILRNNKESIVIVHWDDDKHARRPRPYWRQWASVWGTSGDRACPPIAWMPLPAAFLAGASAQQKLAKGTT